MKVVGESPDHHFLSAVEGLRHKSQGWVGVHLALSRLLNHEVLLESPGAIRQNIEKICGQATSLSALISEKVGTFVQATIYPFSDGDIVILARPRNEEELSSFKKAIDESIKTIDPSLYRFTVIDKDYYRYEKLADERLLAAKKVMAYEALADRERVRTLDLRRRRREEPVVLLVEDDRFTATYTTGFLHGSFDVVLARTGEDAILYYIEHAPDAVLLDLHLPGLNGQAVLQAIRKMDPESYVVMLSVDSAKPHIISSLKGGAVQFLKKPYSQERLLGVIKKAPFIKRRQKS